MELDKLNDLFKRAEEEDKSDFAKMRSSLLLISGEHYNKRGSRFWDRIRSSKDLSNETKLRLTKNHLGRITRRYSNIIVASAPGMAISAANPRETQDQKSAELNQSVWSVVKEMNDWKSTTMEWADDFCGIGESWTKIHFDDSVGAIVGYEPMVDPMQGGAEVVDQNGQLVPDESKPIRAGAVKFEEIYAFNVLRDPKCKSVKKSPWYCIRKMVPTDDLKVMFPNSAEKIEDTKDETFMVFDVGSGYRDSGVGETLVREWFFRPCAKYPKGYWCIQISTEKLAEGELPEDKDGIIFPLVCERFEYVQTKPRGMAITEPLRPYQCEVNRSASKIAEHQITLGDDKLILQNGSKLSAGAQLPGIRSMTVTGSAPTVLEGRAGNQYVDYMLGQIKEMYDIVELEDVETETNLEPHTLLYRSASQKKKYRRYVERFEEFLRNVCKVSLRTARHFMPDEAVIQAVGKHEQINVAEFKGSNNNLIQIKVEAQSEDVESKLGRQMVMNHVLQYVGTQLDPSDIGKIINLMPYANVEESFSDLTMDYENSTNDILSLDRGEVPTVSPYDSHEYSIKRLTQRMKRSDYKFLDQQIQQNYQQVLDQHMKIMDDQKQAMQRAQAGMIPAGGTLIGVDFYVPDPTNPERTRRARVPYDAVQWLTQKLEEQSGFMSQAALIPEEVAADYQSKVEQSAMPMGEVLH